MFGHFRTGTNKTKTGQKKFALKRKLFFYCNFAISWMSSKICKERPYYINTLSNNIVKKHRLNTLAIRITCLFALSASHTATPTVLLTKPAAVKVNRNYGLAAVQYLDHKCQDLFSNSLTWKGGARTSEVDWQSAA